MDRRWEPGEVILWTYQHGAWPVRVVVDDPTWLVTWQAIGSPLVRQVMADGRPTRERPVADRFTDPRLWAVETWTDTSALRFWTPGARHSVWQLHVDGAPIGWYVNLEAPHRRSTRGTHSEDHTLDVWVDLDGSPRLKDVDELEAVVALGQRTAPEAAAIHAEADVVRDAVARRAPPFDGSWLGWCPDPAWSLPALDDDLVAWAGAPGDAAPPW